MVNLITGIEVPIRTLSPIRVAGYFRISDNSPKTDTQMLLRRAVKNRVDKSEGWIYAGSYYDENENCAFERMMTAARTGKFDLLLTESIEHFTPTAEETIQTVEELRSLPSPVRIIFLKDGVDSETVHAVAPIVRGWRP